MGSLAWSACSGPSDWGPKEPPDRGLGGTATLLVGGGKAGVGGRSNGGSSSNSSAGGSTHGEAGTAAGGARSTAGTSARGGNAGNAGHVDAASGSGGALGGADSDAVDGGQAGAGATLEPLSPFLSEYLEHGVYKALEVAARRTGQLDGCELHVYSSTGKSLLRNIALSGFVLPDEPYLLCSAELAAELDGACDRVENLRFGGEQAIELTCHAQVLDWLGLPGASQGLDARDLRRSCDVAVGSPAPAAPYDPSLEWRAYAPTAFDDLGSHCVPGKVPPPELGSTVGGAGGAGGNSGSDAGGSAGDDAGGNSAVAGNFAD